jgi:hypothetical protein
VQINGKIYIIAQQEAPNPSNTYLWEVTQDAATGKLTNVPGSLRAVDTKSVFGTVYLCSGDDTPWCVCQTAAGALVADGARRAVNVALGCLFLLAVTGNLLLTCRGTHMGGEEWEPDCGSTRDCYALALMACAIGIALLRAAVPCCRTACFRCHLADASAHPCLPPRSALL